MTTTTNGPRSIASSAGRFWRKVRAYFGALVFANKIRWAEGKLPLPFIRKGTANSCPIARTVGVRGFSIHSRGAHSPAEGHIEVPESVSEFVRLVDNTPQDDGPSGFPRFGRIGRRFVVGGW